MPNRPSDDEPQPLFSLDDESADTTPEGGTDEPELGLGDLAQRSEGDDADALDLGILEPRSADDGADAEPDHVEGSDADVSESDASVLDRDDDADPDDDAADVDHGSAASDHDIAVGADEPREGAAEDSGSDDAGSSNVGDDDDASDDLADDGDDDDASDDLSGDDDDDDDADVGDDPDDEADPDDGADDLSGDDDDGDSDDDHPDDDAASSDDGDDEAFEDDGSSPLVKAGPRWYRSQIRRFGPVAALAPMAGFGLIAWLALTLSDSRASGIVGLVAGATAAPGLLVAGAPFGDSDYYPFVVMASIPFWLALGWLAARRATRQPVMSWRDYARELAWLALAALVGVIVALSIASSQLGEPLLS